MKVWVRVDDMDRHGEGCACGSCNSIGKSFGAVIEPARESREQYADPLDRVYAPSYESAILLGEVIARASGHEVVEMPEE